MTCKWRKNHDLAIDPLQSCAALFLTYGGLRINKSTEVHTGVPGKVEG
jgi:hypothetical protein